MVWPHSISTPFPQNGHKELIESEIEHLVEKKVKQEIANSHQQALIFIRHIQEVSKTIASIDESNCMLSILFEILLN